MKRTTITLLATNCLTTAATASIAYVAGHTHTSFDQETLSHSGRTDSRGGHNCSAKSKAKGLCSGYHYH